MGKKTKKLLHVFFIITLLFSLGIADMNVGAQTNDFDTIIKNGTILDGSGLERYHADVAIKDGYIAKIGDLSEYTADEEINAEGKFVTPGFIDVHSHAAIAALKEAKSSLTQGVTTEILNPDGGGPTDINERFNLEDSGLAINIGAYIGFNSVWKQVVGDEDRRATEQEINEMKDLITTAMQEGASGVSAGLFYRPAYFADTDEVIDVVSAAREWRTNFPNHQRNENNEVIEATKETIEIGEKSGLVPVITHIKTMGPDNWGKSQEMIRLIDEANERGVYTAADVYPYLRSQTGLTAIVPPWVEEGGRSEMLKRFADPELRPIIAKEIEEIMYSRVEGPEGVYFPTKRKTLADYMETGFDDTQSRALLSFLNFDYNSQATVEIDELQVKDTNGNVVYDYDFNGNNGDEWDASKFDELHSYPSDALNYTISDNAGKVQVAERKQGNASAYGKVTPTMKNVKNSELNMKFRVGDVGKNHRIRLWIDSDDFASGSSFPKNGYGIELHLGSDQIILYERENSKSTTLARTTAGMQADEWFEIKLGIKDNELGVKLWPTSEEEPKEWTLIEDISKEEVIEDQKVMVSMTNRDFNSDNTFYFDQLKVQSVSGDDVYFDYNFEGNDGDAWDSEKFSDIHSYPDNPEGASFSIQDNIGKVQLAKRSEDFCCSTYGKVTTNMKDVKNSDVLLRFRADKLDGDQQLRIFTKADKFLSGMALPVNGFGVEFDLKNDQMNLIKREESSTKEIESVTANLNTDWYTLRLRAVDNEVSARIWKDGEKEPEDWDVEYIEAERELTIGETTMQILETEGSLRTIYSFGHEDDYANFLQHPLIAVASDGGATTSDSVHPRRYGSQPRTLGKFVREEGLISWEEAILKMTSLPASMIGLSDRGYIAEGMVADITIFDPDSIIDNATFDDPKQYADGVEHVFVNGQLALTNGELTGVQAGEAVRVEPNMPSRPLNRYEDIQISENRTMEAVENNEESESAIEFELEQGANDVKATGTLKIVDENNSIDLVSEDFGRIQTFDGWQSFTGSGILNDEKLTTFRVTIDENDPTVDDERPVVTIDIVGEKQIKAFLGEELSDEVDKEALQAKVEEINNEDLDESKYTEESWQALQEALATAEAVLADEEATQEAVDEALDALIAAYAGLEETDGGVNKEALQAKVEEINNKDLDESKYTEESWQALQEALATAEAVLADEDATQEAVNEALKALNAAYEGLEEIDNGVNKEALQAKVEEIKNEELDGSKYTEESWKALQTALRIAEQLLEINNEEITQKVVDKALSNLELAYEKLEAK